MQTNDVSNLFQSEDQLLKARQRSQKSQYFADAGHPIKLKSKAIRIKLRGEHVWVAESGFAVKKLDLMSGKTRGILRGHTGPATCLDIGRTKGKGKEVIITGSWDKSIRVWDEETSFPLSCTPEAHSDFLKCLLILPEPLNLLISGGSDKSIRVWDLEVVPERTSSNYSPTQGDEDETASDQLTSVPTSDLPKLPFLQVLRSHIRPVECLAYRFKPESQSACQLFSADSLGMLKAWSVSVSRVNGSDPVVKIVEDCEAKLHEIGIYDLRVWEDHIWTCSADNSVLLSLFFPSTPSQPPVPIIRIKHPYYVKSLAFYPPLEEVNEDSFPSYLVTGSTDETIRIWDISSGPDDGDSFETVVEKKREELRKAILRQGTHPLPKETNWTLAPLAKVEGHWDEVSGLDIANLTVQGTLQTYLISSSLDCTVRTWDWLEVLRGSFTGEMVLEEKVEERRDENELLDEEERELAALMEQDDN
ncbi:WD40 repeat-like protein [Atractiella rhizophila]|nr:WD40 repeat-like protein [Atractiella rhizophila]